ncbi:hypothetical protein [Arcticibacter eurypsychrophilus]|uniref:hypothetical protein n=1 Tax=Arcticibacter eurypsychrophilus TaxID=1434752 RepID=UPI00084D65CA|nr:hypothetical protein [Arcticibacter eurypsychrophilus]
MLFYLPLEFNTLHFLWLLISILVGLGYAYLLYGKKRTTPEIPQYVYFSLRTISVSLITFLIFAPLLKLNSFKLEKPVLILVQDNSASLKNSAPAGFQFANYQKQMDKFYKSLSQKYEIDTLLLGSTTRPGYKLSFRDKSTDISSFFTYIRNQYAGRNIGAIILASDGLYNQGGDPQEPALSIKAPIYSVAIGDTVPKKDLSIANVNYNETVQSGNGFQIEIQAAAYQSKGLKSRITVRSNKKMLFRKDLNINSNDYQINIPLTLPSDKPGLKKYTVAIDPVNNEISKNNNQQDFYVRIEDSKKNILLVANSPHPDISAIKQALETNKSFEVQVEYAQTINNSAFKETDLIILHQLPALNRTVGNLMNQIKDKPIFFILGAQSNLNQFSNLQNLLKLNSSGQLKEITAVLNPSFSSFVMADSLKDQLKQYGPLSIPFSNAQFKGNHVDLLSQQGGNPATNPLLSFSVDTKPQIAVLAAEGIWKWRLQSFYTYGNTVSIDQLLRKSVQYLLADADKRKFRVYTAQKTFNENERVILNAELYNDAYELINSPDVSITISNSKKQVFSFLFSRINKSYTLDAGFLPVGEYVYQAKTKLGNKSHAAEGRILITENQLELQETKANHQLLRQLSKESGAELFYPGQLDQLANTINKSEMVKTISYADSSYTELINKKALFFLILAFLFLEWFLRKRSGDL